MEPIFKRQFTLQLNTLPQQLEKFQFEQLHQQLVELYRKFDVYRQVLINNELIKSKHKQKGMDFSTIRKKSNKGNTENTKIY